MGTGKIQVSQAITIPATAYEASRGYDARVNLRIECIGTPPAWWGQLWSQPESPRGSLLQGSKVLTGRTLHLGTTLETNPAAKASDARAYSTSYLVRTKGLAGTLQLQDDLPLLKPGSGFGKAAVKIYVPVALPTKTKMAAAAKPVSRVPGARIERLALVNAAQSGIVDLAISYRPLKPATSGNIMVHVVDAHGKEWPYQGRDDAAASIGQKTAVHQANFSVRIGTVPTSAGALTLKGQVVWGDSWPAEFKLPLRNAGGKVVEERPQGTAFRVASTTSRFYPAIAGVHAEANLEGSGGGGLQATRWTSNPHPTLVDNSGKSFPLAKALSFSKSQDAGHPDKYRVGWFVPVKLLPPGISGLKLKTWISADNGPQVPVTIPLDPKAVNK